MSVKQLNSYSRTGLSYQEGPKTIFIVDDETDVQDLIAGCLTEFGITIQTFKSASSVAVGLQKVRPDIVFLDVSLEGSDAIDVLRSLDEADFNGIVQLVSGQDTKILSDLELIGARHLLRMLPPLQKPFRVQQIRDVVLNFVSSSNTTSKNHSPGVHDGYQKLTLAEVLQNNWFQLWYQPKIDLKKMRPVGAEGLARCIHPVFGEVSPSYFLRDADQPSLIKLGERALVQALYDWPLFSVLPFPFKLSINMSIEALIRLPIAKIVRELRPQSSQWPGLIIEITEDQAIKDIQLVHEVATQLRLYNISIAIDDFGSGYSHLARLKELPFSELKIDQSLVRDCDSDEQTASLCRMAIELAHKFETVAVAEGIEKPAEVRTLQQMNCDVGQGFLFAKAVARDTLIRSMQKRLSAAS